MKKKLIAINLLLTIPLLSSCNTDWAWWEDKNISIDKYISLSDAQKALDDSSANYQLATIKKEKYSKKTYYKEYLGKFSTETDSDINSSSTSETKKYTNRVVIKELDSSYEESFLNAKSIKNVDQEIYTYADGSVITTKNVVDYGYGEKTMSESKKSYTSDEALLKDLAIGSTLASVSVDWNKATYGFSKNNEVIVETMSMTTGSYKVKFNNKTLENFVTNTYNLYRLKPIQEGENTIYMMDYSYSKIEKLIGSSIFDEPLSEPYLLEKEETTITYESKDNGDYDIASIPTAVE